MFWRSFDLLTAPRRPDAPRLRFERQVALVRRLDALESLRIGSVVASSDLPLHWPQQVSDNATAVMKGTAWARRRPAGDPRSTRGRDGRACS